jgi:hypothetical protein
LYGDTNPKYPKPSNSDTAAKDVGDKGKAKDGGALGSDSTTIGKVDGKKGDEDADKDVHLVPSYAVTQKLSELYPPLKTLPLTTSRVRALPPPSSPSDTTHGGLLPPLSPRSLAYTKDVLMARDEAYIAEWRATRARMDAEVKGEDVGGLVKWWQRDTSKPMGPAEQAFRMQAMKHRFEVIYPMEGRSVREKKKQKPELRL